MDEAMVAEPDAGRRKPGGDLANARVDAGGGNLAHARLPFLVIHHFDTEAP
jgi:hypothetical protein